MTDRKSVAGGRSFGLAGAYERLLGKAHFSLDPDDPANARIVDLDKAPRGEDGGVRFSADLYVIKPVDVEPPEVGKAFPVLVPQVDADGNEVGGLRLPEVAVPLATYTPWSYRAEEIGAPGELADFRGSFLPFAATRDERQASGDPRPSLEERYRSREEYVGRYTAAALELVEGRYLLAEDLPEMIAHAGRLWELVAGGD